MGLSSIAGGLMECFSFVGSAVPQLFGFFGALGTALAGVFGFAATASVAFGSWLLAAFFGTLTVITVFQAGCRSVPADASEEDVEKIMEQKRRCRYLTLQWSLQIVATLFCLFFVLWAAIYATNILKFIGIPVRPPGLRITPFEDRL